MPIAQYDLILSGYRRADTENAVRFCERTFRNLVGNKKMLLVANDPSIGDVVPKTSESWHVINGSNRLAEFSGWQDGVAFLKNPANGIIFVNDTVATHRYFGLARRLAMVASLRHATGPSFIGFRDSGRGSFSIYNRNFIDWVSTYCFGLTAEALQALSFDLYDRTKVDQCVPGGTDESTFFAQLSSGLDQHLQRWLFQGGWYSSESLNAQNRSKFEYKAKCIIAEKLLTVSCIELNIKSVEPWIEYPFLKKLDRQLHKAKQRLKIIK